MDGKPSRRSILKGGAAAIGGAFLAPMFPGAARAEVGGELRLLAWETMPMQDYLEGWIDENGVTMNVATISMQDDVQVQLIGNTPNRVDVSSYPIGYEDYYRTQLGITTVLDQDKIPNYNEADIFPEFYKKPTWMIGEDLHAVPVIWGLNTLVYNPALVPEPASYSDLLKPEYEGQLTFLDDTVATWPMIARIAGLGDKFPNLTKDELAQAFDAARPYREQSRVFAGSIGDAINLFVNGEIGVVFCGWAGMPMETGPQGVETVSTVPAEGGAMWCDAWFVPHTSENVDTAHAYINELVGPEGNAAIAMNNACGVVNRESVPLLDDLTRSQVNYDDIEAVLASSPIQGMPPRDSGDYATFDDWVAAWEDFKLGF
jgi:spermidine/putrescine-binding protein